MVSMDNAQKRRGQNVSASVLAGTSPSDGGEPLFGGGGAASSADLQLFVRDVRDGLRKSKRPITVRSWSTIKDVKDAIQSAYRIPAGSQRLFFGPLLTLGGELPNHRTLHDVGVYRSGETLLLDIKRTAWGGTSPGTPMYSSLYSLSPSSANDVCISSAMMDLTPKPLRALVQEARRGLALGFKPVLSLDGSAGTYFLHDTRKQRVAVFKPADEEPYAENNPRGYLQQPGQPMRLRDGVDPGQACIREVAAFLLDHDSFSGVPMTTLAEARHPAFNTNGSRLKVSEGGASIGSHSLASMASPSSTLSLVSLGGGAGSASGSPSNYNDRASKAGSFQEFVKVECTMDDISPSKLSVDQVHRIAILDIRILNADRNAANLLVRRRWDNELELVPIDHGYCLRSVADVCWMDWCWLDWPQVKQPLSEDHREYIRNLDIDADAQMLSESLNICQEAIDYFRAASSLLKAGVKAGLSLYEIACLCCRNDNLAEVPSMLEKLFDMAEELAAAAMENDRWDHTAASRALVEQLSPTRRKRNSSMLSLVANSIPSFRLSQTEEDILDLASSAAAAASSPPPLPPGTPSGLTRALEGHGRDSPALLAQSSASDSSSEAGDGHCDKDSRYEWAASVIQDVGVDPTIPVVIPATHRRTMRSGSVVSEEDALSTSPKGFWHIRPGTTPIDDDVSVTWSPCASPRTSSIAFSDRSDAPSPLLPLDDAQEIKLSKPTTVTFANIAPGPYLPPQSAIRVSPFKAEANTGDFPFLQRSESGMSRSKSYSALSVAGSASKKSSFSLLDRAEDEPQQRRRHNLAAAMKDYGDNYEVYRKYFHNFIDLVIVRETSAVRGANSKKQVLSSSAPSKTTSFRLGF